MSRFLNYWLMVLLYTANIPVFGVQLGVSPTLVFGDSRVQLAQSTSGTEMGNLFSRFKKSIGRISILTNTGYLRNCTASVISKKILITAAHCFLDNDGGYFVDPHNVEFNLEDDRVSSSSSQFSVTYVASKIQLGTNRPVQIRNIENDWALVELSTELQENAAPIPVLDVDPFDRFRANDQRTFPVSFLGYPSDRNRGEDLMGETWCFMSVNGLSQSVGAHSHGCDSMSGASGGPLIYDGKLVGLMTSALSIDLDTRTIQSDWVSTIQRFGAVDLIGETSRSRRHETVRFNIASTIQAFGNRAREAIRNQRL